jgi:hypothetical protein
MRYPDGQIVKEGDVVSLAGKIGRVVCSIDDGEYSDDYPEKQWAYLQKGVLIEFETIGLIHYEEPEADLSLVRRCR